MEDVKALSNQKTTGRHGISITCACNQSNTHQHASKLEHFGKICLTIPIGTASVERSFSQMKMIKTRLRNRLGEKSLSHLMKIAIESPRSYLTVT